MTHIDRGIFFNRYREIYGSMNQTQVNGIEFLLTALEADTKIMDIRWAAYMLATVKHECADTWQPIEEYGKGKNHKYGRRDPQTGEVYFGRGFVQLTWAYNYKEMAKILGIDIYHHPDNALQPAVAYSIMSYGMRHGTFTGVRLMRYINAERCDYIGARRIINGTDKAELIAGYANTLHEILHTARLS